MVQWFKFFILRLLGAKPYSMPLAIEKVQDTVERQALVIRDYYRDEAIQAVMHVLKAEQVATLYKLSTFRGDSAALYRMQGQIETLQNLLSFMEGAGALTNDQASSLRKKSTKDASRVLKFKEQRPRGEAVI
jgi:hypothetical protein